MFDMPKRPDVEPPPPPSDPDAEENWSHMQWHMWVEASDEGDDEDVVDVIDDINDCIRDALRALPWDASGNAALRLKYLRAEREYYEALEARDARLRALRMRWYAPGCEERLPKVAPPPAPLNDIAPQPKDGPVLNSVIDKPIGVRTQTGHANTRAGETSGESGEPGQPSEGQSSGQQGQDQHSASQP